MDKTEANKLAWSYRRMAKRYISAADQIILMAAVVFIGGGIIWRRIC